MVSIDACLSSTFRCCLKTTHTTTVEDAVFFTAESEVVDDTGPLPVSLGSSGTLLEIGKKNETLSEEVNSLGATASTVAFTTAAGLSEIQSNSARDDGEDNILDVARRRDQEFSSHRPLEEFAGEHKLPRPSIPTHPAASLIGTRHLPSCTVAGVLAAIEQDRGFHRRFLTEAFDCTDFAATELVSLRDIGAQKFGLSYTMSTPKDMPTTLKRLSLMPDTMPGTDTIWFTVDPDRDDELIVVERRANEGITYSDRFFIEVTIRAKADPAGGVSVTQWVEVVWTSPLPWTHKIATKIVENKIKSDNMSLFGSYIRILTEMSAMA